jgi:hypothetical protein
MKVTDFLVAEDVRNEIGNKHSVMGVLGDSITINAPAGASAPYFVRLAFYVRMELGPTDPDAFSFEFKVFSNDQDVAGLAGKGNKGPTESGFLVLPMVVNGVPVQGEGLLRFRFRVLDPSGKEELLVAEFRPMKVLIERY